MEEKSEPELKIMLTNTTQIGKKKKCSLRAGIKTGSGFQATSQLCDPEWVSQRTDPVSFTNCSDVFETSLHKEIETGGP